MAQEWHYAKDGQRHGPITSRQLRELAASGELRPTDLVWTEGKDEWKPASKIKGLLPEEPVPVPPPVATAEIVKEPQPARESPSLTAVQQLSAMFASLGSQQKVLVSIIGGTGLLMFLCCGGCGVLGMIGGLLDSTPQVSNVDATEDVVMQAEDAFNDRATEPLDPVNGPTALRSTAAAGTDDEPSSEELIQMCTIATLMFLMDLDSMQQLSSLEERRAHLTARFWTTTPEHVQTYFLEAARQLGAGNNEFSRFLLTYRPTREEVTRNEQQVLRVSYGLDSSFTFLYMPQQNQYRLALVKVADKEVHIGGQMKGFD